MNKYGNLIYFKTLRGGYDKNFTYLLGCPETRELALIDAAQPWEELQSALNEASDEGYKLTKVFLTHGHHDHIISLRPAIKATGAEFYAHQYEVERIKKLTALDLKNFIDDRQILKLGQEKLQAFFTPGHQPSSICFIWRDKLFTGDTLFIGTCGRCDLVGSSCEDQLSSMKFLANELPEELVVYPGHDYGPKPFNSLAQERLTNKYLVGLGNHERTTQIEERWKALRCYKPKDF
jgi:hydroxyacylglutathione hydrolase